MAAPILRPEPNGSERKVLAAGVRSVAATLRSSVAAPAIIDNGDLADLWPQVPGTFTKGLDHDKWGIVAKKDDLRAFVAFINQENCLKRGFAYPDTKGEGLATPKGNRKWESPIAGHAYDLEGPDAGELTIPPAPKMGSPELVAEMAEVYGLALLRDFSFYEIETGADNPAGEGPSAADVNDAVSKIPWFTGKEKDKRANQRRKARLSKGKLTPTVLYRGSTEGAKTGPYISQFLLVGNATRGKTAMNDSPTAITSADQAKNDAPIAPAIGLDGLGCRKVTDGFIVYGAQEISQKLRAHKIGKDYMTDWASWLSVQNGVKPKAKDAFEMQGRFITTPRDLATYVHYDQLYQAYLNACLLMLSFEHEFDPGLPEGKDSLNRAAFATYGGPHLLSLMTEVASRALKHARRQKFNTHLRSRPEAIAGALTLAAGPHGNHLGNAEKATLATLKPLQKSGLLDLVSAQNQRINEQGEIKNVSWCKDNYLLPMAFPEGSPMHPSYAAGHATVAGACVTILKAFFSMFDGKCDDVSKKWKQTPFINLYGKNVKKCSDAMGFSTSKKAAADETFSTGIFEAANDGQSLVQVSKKRAHCVTLLGELDKLAANISIGRDMAGVHYYTDYYESLRMGERVAVGILQEQMLTYREEASMSLQTFDDENMIIKGRGDGLTVDVDIEKTSFEDWFSRIG